MKKLFRIFVILPIILLVLYGAAWLLFYINVKHIADSFIAESKTNPAIEFYDANPEISGFPFKPVITYKKGLSYNGVKILFPELVVTGYPFPFQDIEFSAPKGISFALPKSGRKSVYFDRANLTIEVPVKIVTSSEYRAVVKWQQDVGEIKIKHVDLYNEDFSLIGNGIASLNDQLQPELMLHSKIQNYQAIAKRIMEEQGISGFANSMALSLMEGIRNSQNPNENAVSFDVTIKDREIRIGPVYAGRMPIIYWER